MASLTRRKVGINTQKNDAVKSSFFINSNWNPVPGSEKTLEEALNGEVPGLFEEIDGNLGEVQGTEFADGSLTFNIVVPLKDGSAIELRLSGKSELEEGDIVDLSTVKGVTLKKRGEKDIFRYDGKKHTA